jgi:acylphosphatase
MVKHLHIHGTVQGVGFRHHFSSAARSLGITGWVRNRHGGGVEAMIEGAPESLEALIAWARIGPPTARVERIDISDAEGRFSDFELLPTH